MGNCIKVTGPGDNLVSNWLKKGCKIIMLVNSDKETAGALDMTVIQDPENIKIKRVFGKNEYYLSYRGIGCYFTYWKLFV